MSKKSRKTLIKQIIQPANDNAGTDVGLKPHDGSDRPPAKVAEAKAVSKRKTKRRTAKNDGAKRFDFKAAESQAAACQSVYIKKSDITTIISIGSHILGKFLAALDQKLMTLKVPAYIRSSLNRTKGTRSSTDAHLQPTLNMTKIVTCYRFGHDLTADDISKIVKIDKEEFQKFQAEEETVWNSNQDELALAHSAEQIKAEVEHYREQAIAEAAFVAIPSNRGTAYQIVPFNKVPYVKIPYAKIPYAKSPAVAALVPGSNYEYKQVDGVFIKVNAPHTEEIKMNVSEAIVKVNAGLVTCPELDQLRSELSLATKRWSRNDADRESNERMMTNTFWESLSTPSKTAMALHVPGGMLTLNAWKDERKFLLLIDAFLDTHDQSDCYEQLSVEEKEAFRRQQTEYLSPATLKQSDSESVIRYIARMQRRFELSVKLKDIIGSSWEHTELKWIQMLVAGVNGKNPNLHFYNESIAGRRPLHQQQSYMPTFKSQCEHLLKISGEESFVHVMPTLKSSKPPKKPGKVLEHQPSSDILVSTLGNVLATHQSDKDDPVRHYIDYSRLSDKQLSGILKANKARLKHLPSDDSEPKNVKFSTDPPSHPTASHEAKKPPSKYNGKPYHKNRKPGRPPNALVAEDSYDDDAPFTSDALIADDYYDDDDSLEYEDDDEESEDEYATVTIAVTEPDSQHLHSLCALISRETQGFGAELSKRYCLGHCCDQRRHTIPSLANHATVQAPSFRKCPHPSTLSPMGWGQFCLDTGATIQMLTEEHAGSAEIKSLSRPIVIRGVSKHMTTEINKYFIHQLFGLCLVSDRISILSYYMLLAMDWTVKSASKEVITLTHPKLKNKSRNGISFYRNRRMYVAFDPTLLSTWAPLSGEDCIGHLGSVINEENQPRLMYRT